uniref:Lysozyme n=1 Tax=Amphimedon queenslandica TaxID=400682 RepID=A0A1X7TH95_AMPQE
MKKRMLPLLALSLPLLLLLQPSEAAVTGECNSYEREKVNEGYYECLHTDPRTGLSYLGVGFNLYGYEADTQLGKVGANYINIMNGTECLNDTQIKELFKLSMADALECASNFLYKSWSPLTLNAKSAIIDMAFDYHYIGCYPVFPSRGLQDFVNLRSALSEKPPNYDKAGSILKDSTWCGQEPKRCQEAIDCIQSKNKQ